MGGFWSELKRRNVVKVGIAYGAAGWVVVQIASVLFPLFGAPTWVLKVVTALVMLGFPLALVFAWAFELTPQGLKRSEDVTPEMSATRSTGRMLNFVVIGVLAAGLGLFALDRFVWNATRTAASSDAASASVEPAKPTAGAARKSIAVLPFVNMSNDPEQEYFSDGIAEELMSALARFSALKVAARTSAFSFKGKDADLREVGLALNVATVLEGSVRRSGEHLRITAQLSDVATGYQLWSETYDRELTDIFAIQDDITSRSSARCRFISKAVRRRQRPRSSTRRSIRSCCAAGFTGTSVRRRLLQRQPNCCRRPPTVRLSMRPPFPRWPMFT